MCRPATKALEGARRGAAAARQPVGVRDVQQAVPPQSPEGRTDDAAGEAEASWRTAAGWRLRGGSPAYFGRRRHFAPNCSRWSPGALAGARCTARAQRRRARRSGSPGCRCQRRRPAPCRAPWWSADGSGRGSPAPPGPARPAPLRERSSWTRRTAAHAPPRVAASSWPRHCRYGRARGAARCAFFHSSRKTPTSFKNVRVTDGYHTASAEMERRRTLDRLYLCCRFVAEGSCCIWGVQLPVCDAHRVVKVFAFRWNAACVGRRASQHHLRRDAANLRDGRNCPAQHRSIQSLIITKPS
eukprot:scaffold7328_cov314-Pinguiococcus_pyrenoidosus.AAC.73